MNACTSALERGVRESFDCLGGPSWSLYSTAMLYDLSLASRSETSLSNPALEASRRLKGGLILIMLIKQPDYRC